MIKENHLFIGVCKKCESPVFLADCSGKHIAFDTIYTCPEDSTLIYRTCECDSELVRRSYLYNYYVLPSVFRTLVCLGLLFTIPRMSFAIGLIIFLVFKDINEFKLGVINKQDILIEDYVEIEGEKTLFIGSI